MVIYQPQFRPTGTQSWTNFGGTQTGASTTITGLNSATSYDFQVVATDGVHQLASFPLTQSTPRFWYNQPFANTSHWNLPIGSNATWSTGADTNQLRGVTGTITSTNFGQPFYIGQASDPVITCTTTNTIFPCTSQQVHIPIGAQPALGGSNPDGEIHLFDTTQPNLFFSYANGVFDNAGTTNTSTASTTTLTSYSGIVMDSRGDGLAIPAVTNGCFSYGEGTIRLYDFLQGKIEHKLRCALGGLQLRSATYNNGDNNGAPGGVWTTNIAWPMFIQDYDSGNLNASQYGTGHYCYGVPKPIGAGGTGHNGPWTLSEVTGQVFYGSTFGIPISGTPNAVDMRTSNPLGLNPGALWLGRCLQNYGAVINDRTEDGLIAFDSEPQVSGNATMTPLGVTVDTLYNQADAAWRTLSPYICVMTNQASNNINGGGTPIVTGPPALA